MADDDTEKTTVSEKRPGPDRSATVVGLGIGIPTVIVAIISAYFLGKQTNLANVLANAQGTARIELVCHVTAVMATVNPINEGLLAVFYYEFPGKQDLESNRKILVGNDPRQLILNAQYVQISDPYASCSLTEHGQVSVSKVDLPVNVTFKPLLALGVGATYPFNIHIDNLDPATPYRFGITSGVFNSITLRFGNAVDATLSTDGKQISLPLVRDDSVSVTEDYTFPGARIEVIPPQVFPRGYWQKHLQFLPSP